MKLNENVSTIKIKGVNINRAFKLLLKNNIHLSKINRQDYKTLTFNVKSKNVNKVFAILNNPCYTISVEKSHGFLSVLNFLKKRFGIIISIVLCLIMFFVNTMFISSIKIYGNNKIQTEEILNALNNKGVYVGAKSASINLENLEDYLSYSVEGISFVSIIRKGTTIVVNVKEKLFELNDLSNQNVNFVAKYSGTITEMLVTDGTPLLKVGDSFKQGDVLVAGYNINGEGVKIPCVANAKIKAKIWFSYSEVFSNEVLQKVRTGKKITNYTYNLLGWNLKEKNNEINFKSFEVEEKRSYVFKNNFIPLVKNSIIYYETEEIVVNQNFEENKQEIVNRCYEKAKEKIPNGIKIEKSFDVIEEIKEGYVVSAYYETEIYI